MHVSCNILTRVLTFRDALAEHKLESLATFLPVEMLTFIQVKLNPHSVSYFTVSSHAGDLSVLLFNYVFH